MSFIIYAYTKEENINMVICAQYLLQANTSF